MSDVMGGIASTLGYCLGLAAGADSGVAQRLAAMDWFSHLRLPQRRIDPGIYWERTGGKTHRVVIRREAEFVPDFGGIGR